MKRTNTIILIAILLSLSLTVSGAFARESKNGYVYVSGPNPNGTLPIVWNSAGVLIANPDTPYLPFVNTTGMCPQLTNGTFPGITPPEIKYPSVPPTGVCPGIEPANGAFQGKIDPYLISPVGNLELLTPAFPSFDPNYNDGSYQGQIRKSDPMPHHNPSTPVVDGLSNFWNNLKASINGR
jgi:hypothetical protein